MCRFHVLLACAPLLVSACQTSPPPLTPARRDSLAAEVREVVRQLTDAMNAHDPQRVLAFYKDLEEFVYVGCTDPMFGSDFFKGIVGPYYAANPDVTFQREILRIQVLGPTSAVATLQGSSTRAQALFWTQVLTREEDGRWLITHEHESWPGCKEPPARHPTGVMPAPGEGS